MSTNIKVYVYVTREQDDYNHGCNPSTFEDLGCIEKLQFSDFNQLKMNIDLSNCEVYENRLDTNRMVNADGYEASSSQLEEWKTGKRKLWLESTTYYLSYITETELTENELKSLIQKSEV